MKPSVSLRKVTLRVTAFAAAMAASGLLVACGGDDTGNPTDGGSNDVTQPPVDSGGGNDSGHDSGGGGNDAGHDSGGGNDSGGSNDAGQDSGGGNDSGADAGDAADGACDFNAFVTGLITNHTNQTDSPSTDLGQSCVDTQTPFPSTIFK